MTFVVLINDAFFKRAFGMTRLKEEEIKQIGCGLHAYDAGLIKKTGHSLKQIAMRAAGLSEREMGEAMASTRVAVVPVTCGQGIITGFAGAVGGILRHIGANAFQPEVPDIGGLAESVARGADIVFGADDQRFIALHLSLKKVIDNAEATASGYVEALSCIAGSLDGREVLVLGGAGQVGWHAVSALRKKGAKVAVYDPDQRRLASLLKDRETIVESNLEEALRRHSLLFDASPAVNIIRVEHIKAETMIAAPGIPLGLTEGAYNLVKERLIHDPLQLGVATMLAEALVE
jgi:3-methylornithyl-N6-L-lysine dehydrogenase